ncbi:DUF262 domain-containing protein [Nonomuraea sp. NPDC050790]|uniref:DUF262 domain-containing protein n=1 Tax=Nonomuraea sp. NPDC050790 TaxID=3364371 RepID=UPI0037B521AE
MSVGLDTRPSATTFPVARLVELAWRGHIRVPEFQRDFRWTRKDVMRLFDSIVRGYPIGSLLLWIKEAPAGPLKLGVVAIDAPALDSAWWVVDGQQRIISLANGLHPDGAADSRFALSYDLVRQECVPRPATDDPLIVPLPVLFDLQLVLKWFAMYPEISEYLDHASQVTARLRQYEVSAIQVEQDDIDVLRDIFDRMNSYGRHLSRAEIFSAIHPSRTKPVDGALSLELIASQVDDEFHFGVIDTSTVLRAVLARRGAHVSREMRGEFDEDSKITSDFPRESRDEAFRRGAEALKRAVGFLQKEAGVPHFSFLAYRYLLVVLTRFFAHYPVPGDHNVRLLRRWFWRAAILGPGVFRGSATGAMQTLGHRIMPGDIAGSLQGLFGLVNRAEFIPINLKRFRTDESATRILLCSWWDLHPRWPVTGEEIESAQLAESLVDQATAARAVRAVFGSGAVSRILAANRILLPTTTERDSDSSLPLDEVLGNQIDSVLSAQPLDLDTAEWSAVLRSHSIEAEAEHALVAGDVDRFLAHREQTMQGDLQLFLARMCEWEQEDTPSLDDLIIGDIEEDVEEQRDDAL